MIQMNPLWNRNKFMDKGSKPVVAKGEGAGEGMEGKAGVSRCKLLYMEWVNNKVLLCSTGNSI